MSLADGQEGCFRAYLKPGQEFPEPPSEKELQDAVREGRVFAVVNGKRLEKMSSESEIEKVASRWVSYSMSQLMEGKAAEEVENDLMARGIKQNVAKFLVEQAMLTMKNRLDEWHKKQITPPKKSAPVDEKKEVGKMQMFIGGILLGVGLLITFASYGISEPGGKYVLAYGAIIVGAWNMIRGFFRRL